MAIYIGVTKAALGQFVVHEIKTLNFLCGCAKFLATEKSRKQNFRLKKQNGLREGGGVRSVQRLSNSQNKALVNFVGIALLKFSEMAISYVYERFFH